MARKQSRAQEFDEDRLKNKKITFNISFKNLYKLTTHTFSIGGPWSSG